MAGEHAADQMRMERPQLSHHPQSIDPHLIEMLLPLVAFDEIGVHLNLIANLPVRRQILGVIAMIDAHFAGGFTLGGEILGLLAQMKRSEA
jgi:hypothetical protein